MRVNKIKQAFPEWANSTGLKLGEILLEAKKRRKELDPEKREDEETITKLEEFINQLENAYYTLAV